MFPATYTTYGMAMGHQPETLAASGGLRPAGAERLSACPARVGVAQARRWPGIFVAWMRLRHRDAGSQSVDLERMRAEALPSNQ
jgi:hypothetical protein